LLGAIVTNLVFESRCVGKYSQDKPRILVQLCSENYPQKRSRIQYIRSQIDRTRRLLPQLHVI